MHDRKKTNPSPHVQGTKENIQHESHAHTHTHASTLANEEKKKRGTSTKKKTQNTQKIDNGDGQATLSG